MLCLQSTISARVYLLVSSHRQEMTLHGITVKHKVNHEERCVSNNSSARIF